MIETHALLDEFEACRPHLRSVAFRMLGSLPEAEDAVQEAWLHVLRADPAGLTSPGGFLTTVVARVCLDMLRARKSRREDSVGEIPEPAPRGAGPRDPEAESVLAESVGLALLVVLETLEPAERLAFVLHDLFALSFDEIGPLVGRSAVATRQLASRARRRVQGAPAVPEQDLARQRRVVGAFLSAMRAADFDGVLAVLAPDLVVYSDAQAVATGAPRELRGAARWARGAVAFSRSAGDVRMALVDGGVGLILAPRGQLQRALRFTFAGDRIDGVEILADPGRLARLELGVLEALPGGEEDVEGVSP